MRSRYPTRSTDIGKVEPAALPINAPLIGIADEILANLGYNRSEIAALREKKVI